jgi:DNA-binding response OmpR family regulator
MVTQKSVLLVNNDSTTSQLWVSGLKRMGLGVAVTYLKTAPRNRLTTGRFSLIIIALPASSVEGLTLCRQLRLQTRKAILLLVGVDDERVAVAAYQAGADEYIVGPISSALLLAKVTAWLRWAESGPNL